MEEPPTIIRSSSKIEATQSKRRGILERLLLTASDTTFQNIILIETAQGSDIEIHEISTSESIFILNGSYELVLKTGLHPLATGDLVFFHPRSSHGLRCVEGPGRFLVIFAPTSEPAIDKDWLHLIYSEAWRQYTHEDMLSQKRNNLYVAIQAGLIAISTGVFSSFLKMEPLNLAGANLDIGSGLLGITFIFVSTFSLLLTNHWAAVTRAGQGYINIRWSIARMVEQLIGGGQPTIAGLETAWEVYAKKNPSQPYQPFPDITGLSDIRIPPGKRVGGWVSTLRIIRVVRYIWSIVLIAGIGLLAGMMYIWFIS